MIGKPAATCLKIMLVPCIVVDQSVLVQFKLDSISQSNNINPVGRYYVKVSYSVGSLSDRNFISNLLLWGSANKSRRTIGIPSLINL